MLIDAKTSALEKSVLAAVAHKCGYRCGGNKDSECQGEH